MREVYALVSKLQSKLVAYKDKDWERVHFFQIKLMMSFEARVLAVRKIIVNDGNKTPGLDNVIWDNLTKKFQAIKQLREILVKKSGTYQAGPVRGV